MFYFAFYILFVYIVDTELTILCNCEGVQIIYVMFFPYGFSLLVYLNIIILIHIHS